MRRKGKSKGLFPEKQKFYKHKCIIEVFSILRKFQTRAVFKTNGKKEYKHFMQQVRWLTWSKSSIIE